MKNLLRYEFYKARHNLLSYMILFVCFGIALFFTSKDYLLEPMIPDTPNNITGIFMNEVADAGIAILIIVGSYIIFSFGDDLKHRCINYELLSGNSRKKVFLSHYIWSFLFSGSIITIALIIGCCKYGIYRWMMEIVENRTYILRTVLEIYIISFAIISPCLIFAITMKDTARSTIAAFVFLFLSCYIMAAIVDSGMDGQIASAYENPKGILLVYPAYLWRWVLTPGLSSEQFVWVNLFAVIWCAISFLVSNYLFCKMELN